MKISVIGAGAMGSLYGGKLAQAGNEVILFDINQAHVDAINSSGLEIEELEGEESSTISLKATSQEGDVKGSEVLIFFVKSTATRRAAEQFCNILDSDTLAVTLQNGVGNEEILRSFFGADSTAAGVTSQGATFLGPGKIRHAGKGPTHLCMSNKKNMKLRPFVEELNKAGFETHIDDNIEDLIWSKLIINVGINALTALTGLQNGRLLDFENTKSLMKDLVEEAVAVAKKKGITLTYDDPLNTVFDVAKKTATNRSSMLQDFDRGTISEIEFINSAIVREGEALGVPTPVNSTMARLVSTIDTIHLYQKQENL